MNKILNFFKGIGHRVGQALGFVIAHISEEQLQSAITYVELAEDKGIDNVAKRNYVVQALMATGMGENFARMLTELAVGMVKKQLHQITEDTVTKL